MSASADAELRFVAEDEVAVEVEEAAREPDGTMGEGKGLLGVGDVVDERLGALLAPALAITGGTGDADTANSLDARTAVKG